MGSPFNPSDDDTADDDGEVPVVSDVPDCPEAPITGHSWEGVTLWPAGRGSDVTEAYERCEHCGWYRINTDPTVFEMK